MIFLAPSKALHTPYTNKNRNFDTENCDDLDNDPNQEDEYLDGEKELGSASLSNTGTTPKSTTKKISKGGALSKIRKKALHIFQSSSKSKEDAVPCPEFMVMLDTSSGSFAQSSTQLLMPISPYARDATLPRPYTRDATLLRPSLESEIGDGSPTQTLGGGNEEEKTIMLEFEPQLIGQDHMGGDVRDGKSMIRYRQGSASPTRSALTTVEREQRKRGPMGARNTNDTIQEVADRLANGDSGAGKGSLSPPRNSLRRSKSLPAPKESEGANIDGCDQRETEQDNTRRTRLMRHKSHGPVRGPGSHAVDDIEANKHDNSRRTRLRKSQGPAGETALYPIDGSDAKNNDNSRRTRFMRRKTPDQIGEARFRAVDDSEANEHDHSRRTRFIRRNSEGLSVEETSRKDIVLSPRTKTRRSTSWTNTTESAATSDRSDRRERSTNPTESGETPTTAPRRRVRRINSRSRDVDFSAQSEQEDDPQDPDPPCRRRLRPITSKSHGVDGETDHVPFGSPSTTTGRHRRVNSLNKGITSARSERKGDLGCDRLSPRSPTRRRLRDSNKKQNASFGDGLSPCTTPRHVPKEDPRGLRHRIKRSNSRSIPVENEANEDLRGTIRGVSPSKNARALGRSESPSKREQNPDDSASLKASDRNGEHPVSRIRRRRESVSPVKTSQTQARYDSPIKRRPSTDAVGALGSSKRYEERKTRRSPPRSSGGSSRKER